MPSPDGFGPRFVGERVAGDRKDRHVPRLGRRPGPEQGLDPFDVHHDTPSVGNRCLSVDIAWVA
jgi:hypothetical protein